MKESHLWDSFFLMNNMKSVERYLNRNTLYDSLISKEANNDLKVIVTIPAYNEPDILECLNSFLKCDSIDGSVEIIVLINSSESESDKNILEINEQSYKSIKSWISTVNSSFITFHVLYINNLPSKNAGVGLARKICMDEALRRFVSIENYDGIIVGYDADTICETNYFTSIESYFADKRKNGASIYFEHPIKGKEYTEMVYLASAYYELYLRYYNMLLRYLNHPHAYHCIGSAFAVRASIYAAQGGMNKKQAGEDFYFIQKIIAIGNFGYINTTCLHPSSRISERTPFGTGRSINEMINSSSIDYLTFAFDSILPLKEIFNDIDKFYNETPIIDKFSEPLKSYLLEINFIESLKQINSNCSSLETFRMKFYMYFNIFKILKYLNFVSRTIYPKSSVIEESYKLLTVLSEKVKDKSVFTLLERYRDLDRLMK